MAECLKISEVAKLMNLSTDSIRFYERKGIIDPTRMDDNSYRIFNLDDIRRLYDCRAFQNIGFTLTEIESMIKETSYEEIKRMLLKKESQLQDQMKDTQLALYKIHKMIQIDKTVSGMKDEFFIQKSPHVFIYYYAKKNKLARNSVFHKNYANLIRYHNLFDCTVIIPYEQLNNEKMTEECNFGFSIDKERAFEWSLSLGDPFVEYPSRTSVYTAFTTDGLISHKDIVPMLTWVENHNFTVLGDVLCRLTKVTYDKGREKKFYEIWLPIKKA